MPKICLPSGFVEVGQAAGVGFRDDQQMARIDREEVTEGEDPVVLVDDAGVLATGDDLAEQAGHAQATASFSTGSALCAVPVR